MTAGETRRAGALRQVAAVLAHFLAIFLPVACGKPDPALPILAHRQDFKVTLKSWTPRGGQALAELEVVPTFAPRIDTLTVRIVAFDAAGSEIRSVRAPLEVAGFPVGLPSVVRAEFPPPPPGGGLGVEVEASPPVSAWREFPELAGVPPPARR